jgi:organic hydroperoxide reductase OsmC/OhrA
VIQGSADRTFRGDADRWDPERLLVASLSQCHMLSCLHQCADAAVDLTAYEDHAAGTMITDADGGGRFTEVVLRPAVGVADESMVEPARALHDRANQLCFIANSVSFPVRHEPTVGLS